MSQLDRRLSTISITRLQAKQSATRKNESERDRVLDFSPSPDNDSNSNNEQSTSSNIEYNWQTDGEMADGREMSEGETERSTEEEGSEDTDGITPFSDKGQRLKGGRFTRRESLLERKKRDYFKFTLIPTCGVQFNEGSNSTQENKEVLI